MKRFVSPLSADERELLHRDIQYLNMAELREFCGRIGIPYMIGVERAERRIVKTRDPDRKGIVIDRILHFLRTGAIDPPTTFPYRVVSTGKSERTPAESDAVLYREYKNGDSDTLKLMKSLTNGKFEFGAIAQEVLRASWSHGEAPAYHEFARLWEKALAQHTGPNPEWAYLTDLASGTAGPDWKRVRNQKAAAVIALLRRLREKQQLTPKRLSG